MLHKISYSIRHPFRSNTQPNSQYPITPNFKQEDGHVQIHIGHRFWGVYCTNLRYTKHPETSQHWHSRGQAYGGDLPQAPDPEDPPRIGFPR